MQTRNQYLDYLIDPSLQGVNRLFVSLFLDNKARTDTQDTFFLRQR